MPIYFFFFTEIGTAISADPLRRYRSTVFAPVVPFDGIEWYVRLIRKPVALGVPMPRPFVDNGRHVVGIQKKQFRPRDTFGYQFADSITLKEIGWEFLENALVEMPSI